MKQVFEFCLYIDTIEKTTNPPLQMRGSESMEK